MCIVAPRLGLPVNQDALTSVTRGLVGDTSFAILPEVTKEHTFILTFLFQLVRTLLPFDLSTLSHISRFLSSKSGASQGAGTLLLVQSPSAATHPSYLAGMSMRRLYFSSSFLSVSSHSKIGGTLVHSVLLRSQGMFRCSHFSLLQPSSHSKLSTQSCGWFCSSSSLIKSRQCRKGPASLCLIDYRYFT